MLQTTQQSSSTPVNPKDMTTAEQQPPLQSPNAKQSVPGLNTIQPTAQKTLKDEILQLGTRTSTPTKGCSIRLIDVQNLMGGNQSINLEDYDSANEDGDITQINNNQDADISNNLTNLHQAMITSLIVQQPTTKVINNIILATNNNDSTSTDQKERFANYERRMLDTSQPSNEKITNETFETIKEQSTRDIPTASPISSTYRALRAEFQKMIRIDHHIKSLSICTQKGHIPAGLSLYKKLNVIGPKPELDIDLRRIQYKAEIETLERLLSHYQETQIENLSACRNLDKLYYRLPSEERLQIRSKMILMSESLAFELKQKRSKKQLNVDINTDSDRDDLPLDNRQPPKPQRRPIRGRRRIQNNQDQ